MESPQEKGFEDQSFTEADQIELSNLEKSQTSGDGWIRERDKPRLEELRKKKEGGPSEEQKQRFIELSKLQTKGGPGWTSELQEEIKKLYPLFSKN